MNRPFAFSAALRVMTAAFAGWVGNAAQAQVSAWLDFEGQIKGEATDSRHKDWIEIQSFSNGAVRTVSQNSSQREVSSPSVSELTLVKLLDQSSPALFSRLTSNDPPLAKATLDLNMGTLPVVRLELENVLVSGLTFAANTGEDRPVEMLSLNFTKITFTYFRSDSSSTFTSYDLATGQAGSGGGTVPTDSDGDGMPDAWESQYGLINGVNDANGDLDGDGLKNLHEYQLGTNPASGSSFFKATLASDPANPASWLLTWNSVVNKTYLIQWSPDLKTPFTTLRTVTATSTTTTESVAKTANLGFFRVRPQ